MDFCWKFKSQGPPQDFKEDFVLDRVCSSWKELSFREIQFYKRLASDSSPESHIIHYTINRILYGNPVYWGRYIIRYRYTLLCTNSREIAKTYTRLGDFSNVVWGASGEHFLVSDSNSRVNNNNNHCAEYR